MTSLEEREHAFENEFAHQQELEFRAREVAVRALARWAAGRLGRAGEAVEVYGNEVVAADVMNPTVEGTIDRLAEALAPKGISKVEIRQMMDKCLAAADSALRSTLQSPR